MMKHLTHLDFAIFKKDSETVMNTFTKSLQGLEKFNRFVLGSLMSNIIEIVIVSLMLYGFLGPKYFLNTICTYSIYMYLTKQLSDRRKVLLKEKWKADVNTENKIHDIVHNIDTVKYFQQENRESENFSHIVQGVREKDQKVIKSLANLNSVQNLVISLGMLINLGMGIFDCYSGLMTPGDLVMLQAIFAQIILPLNFMGMLMREVEETKVNLQYAINMINEKEKSEQTNKVMMNNMFNFTSGKIEFENVSFGFHPGKLIMNKMNLVFEPNTVNGIVGFSGQGKSTLFCLLYRLYEAQSGRILVDNQEISKVNLDSLRKHLTICPQNGHLFNESIYYNLLYGNPEATLEQIEQVTKDVNIFHKIEQLPQGFDTNVGSLGSKLSGGEKQRLLLARSFLKNSNILLLDEPTSNLDNYNERIILDYIHKIKKDKVVIITGHRLSTITECDTIHVMDKGSMCEQGSHSKLMQNKNGIYYEMFTRHMLKE